MLSEWSLDNSGSLKMLTQEFFYSINGETPRAIVWRLTLPTPIVRRPFAWRCESTVSHTTIDHVDIGDTGLDALRFAMSRGSFQLALLVHRGAKLWLPNRAEELTPWFLASCFGFQPKSPEPSFAEETHENDLPLRLSKPTTNTTKQELRWIKRDGTEVILEWNYATPTGAGDAWNCLGWVEGTNIYVQTRGSSSLLAMIACMEQVHFAIQTMIEQGEHICFPFDPKPLTSELFSQCFGFRESPHFPPPSQL